MSNCFELRWKLFWSVCKLPRILSIKLKYPGFLRFILGTVRYLCLRGRGRFLEWGGGLKFSKSMKKGGVFFKVQIRGGKLLETVVSTLV